MSTKAQQLCYAMHPMIIFWIGVLTGAVVVTLVFFYKFMSPADYETMIFKSNPAIQKQIPSMKLNNFGKNTPKGGSGSTMGKDVPQGGKFY